MSNTQGNINTLRQSFRNYINSINRYRRYIFLSIKFKVQNIYWRLKRYKKVQLIVWVGIFVLLAILLLYSKWDWIDSQVSAQEPLFLSNLLIGIGTVVAGVLAILLSVSLFVIQNAAENYTPSTLERFAGDRGSLVFYIIIGLTSIIIFSLSIFIRRESDFITFYIVISFALLIITFLLAYWHYTRMARMVNPLKLLDVWSRDCLNQISFVDRRMSERIEWLKYKQKSASISNLKPDEYQSLSKAGFYIMDRTIHATLENKIRQIHSMVKIGAIRRDDEIVESGLNYISKVHISYLLARKESTVPLPTYLPFNFTVDYKPLFDISFQELKEICRIGINQADENLIRRVIESLSSIGVKSVEVIPTGNVVVNNPITGLIIQYIISIVEESSRHNYTDVCLSGVEGIKAIGQRALTNKIPNALDGVYEQLEKIAVIGIAQRKLYIVDKIMECLAIFPHQAIKEEYFRYDRIVEDSLKLAQKITNVSLPYVEIGGVEGSVRVTHYLGAFYDPSRSYSIPYITQYFLPRISGETNGERNIELAIRQFTDINEKLYMFYRQIGEKVGKNESFIIFLIHQGIEVNIKSILSAYGVRRRRDFMKLIHWYLSFYSIVFDAHEKITKNYHLEIVDSLSFLGIRSIKEKWLEVAQSCSESISSIASTYIQKGESFEWEAPRIIMNAIYVMMVAKNKPLCRKIVDKVISDMHQFQSSYVKKLESIDKTGKFRDHYKNRLLNEFNKLRREFERRHPYTRSRNKVEDYLFDNIQESDFDDMQKIINDVIEPRKIRAK